MATKIVILLFAVISSTLASCPTLVKHTDASSYQELGDDCYYFSVKSELKFDAEGICLDAEGYLVSIHSKEENEFIRKHLSDTYQLVNTTVYIGLEEVLGTKHWNDHSPMDFQNFAPGQDFGRYQKDLLICAVIHTGTGYWQLERCYFEPEAFPFVCKFKDANVN